MGFLILSTEWLCHTWVMEWNSSPPFFFDSTKVSSEQKLLQSSNHFQWSTNDHLTSFPSVHIQKPCLQLIVSPWLLMITNAMEIELQYSLTHGDSLTRSWLRHIACAVWTSLLSLLCYCWVLSIWHLSPTSNSLHTKPRY